MRLHLNAKIKPIFIYWNILLPEKQAASSARI